MKSLFTVFPRDRTDERIKTLILRDPSNVAYLLPDEKRRLDGWIRDQARASSDPTTWDRVWRQVSPIWYKGSAADEPAWIEQQPTRDLFNAIDANPNTYFSIADKSASLAHHFLLRAGPRMIARVHPEYQTEPMCVNAVKATKHAFKYCAVLTMPVLEALFDGGECAFAGNLVYVPDDFDPFAVYGSDPTNLRGRVANALEDERTARIERQALAHPNPTAIDVRIAELKDLKKTLKPKRAVVKRPGTRVKKNT